jgi:PilZ domain
MIEKRASPRVRTLKRGSIVFGVASTVDCVVRNLSETGACLEVASPIGIPDDFTLQIRPEPTRRDCHVAWRSANRIGVYFK